MFFLPIARIGCLPISEKNFISMDVKHMDPALFSVVFFLGPQELFLNRYEVCFYFLALVNFSRNMSKFFFCRPQ